jgi:hypothetical protein
MVMKRFGLYLVLMAAGFAMAPRAQAQTRNNQQAAVAERKAERKVQKMNKKMAKQRLKAQKNYDKENRKLQKKNNKTAWRSPQPS